MEQRTILNDYPAADSGFTVAEKIQTLTRTPVPMIFTTASKQPGFRRKAHELGAAGSREKPYEAETLLATIRDVLNPQVQVLEPKS